MPAFGLAHKPSRSKMRSVSSDSVTTTTPSSHSQRTDMLQQPPISPAPMHLETSSSSGSGSGFKMFNWKRKGSGSSVSSATEGSSTGSEPRPFYPAEPPRPILKTAISDQGPSGRGIRFAASAGGVWDSPETSAGPVASAMRGDANGQGGGGQPLFIRSSSSQSQGAPPQLQIQVHHANLERQSQTLESMGMTSPTCSVSRTKSTSPRRSSRPASPSASSFGQRIRTELTPTTVSSSSSSSASCSPPRQTQNQPLPRRDSRHSPIPSVMCTPPAFCPSHVTTPPVAYCSSMQSRVPPPPAPYRPTTTQDRTWPSTTRALPEQLPLTREMAPCPPHNSSLFASVFTLRSSRPRSRPTSGASISGLAVQDVPMLNIIPATPQEHNDEFAAGGSAGPSRRRVPEELGEAVQIHEMTEIPLAEGGDDQEEITSEASLPKSDSTPAIRVELDFSPFSPNIDLALDDYVTSSNTSRSEQEVVPSSDEPATITTEPVQSTQHDMDSYPSLPSLSSQTSITSGMSLRSSSSMSSVMTFPDVEEALGSMLASLSDGQITFDYDAEMMNATSTSTKSQQGQPQYEHEEERERGPETPSNPGLGLGLDFPQPAFITAPLSPRKSRSKPGRIDTALAQSMDLKSFDSAPGSAPPVINHRVAFYGTARAHPRSPNSGVFTQSLTDISTHCDNESTSPTARSESGLEVEVEEEIEATTPTLRCCNGIGMPKSPSSGALSTASRDSIMTMSSQSTTVGCRDSISGHSESSDEDLHTASIINLTPMCPGRSFGGNQEREMGMRDEEIMVDDVGLAL